ncbi:MAG: hypothetical protein Q8900_10305, partial [Bacillota bacterium]|nr:hypothetical protein [Bacillota bacterium]
KMSNQVIQILTPVINLIIVAILGFLGKEVLEIVPKAVEFLVSKIGLNNYTKLKATAKDIFMRIEEDGRLGKLVGSKIDVFNSTIKARFPQISDAEIDLIRQAIAGEFNKDRTAVINDIENPVQEVKVEPIVKYVTPDGTELQPVSIPNANSQAVDPSTQQTA